MSLLNIIAGDYGQVMEITITDVDTPGKAADISGYADTIEAVFTDAAEAETAKPATFKTDGTDGKIIYTTEEGFLIAGKWRVRGRVQGAGTKLTSVEHTFEVGS